MKKTGSFGRLLVIILAITLLISCGSQSSDEKTGTISQTSPPPSGKSFRFDEVEIFQCWPLPAGLAARVGDPDFTYEQIWEVVFDFLPKEALDYGTDIPIHRTPTDGKYYPNQFYIHPDFDKILGKGDPREIIGIFFVKDFDEDMVDIETDTPLTMGDKLPAFYIESTLVTGATEQMFMRLVASPEIGIFNLGTHETDYSATVRPLSVERLVDAWLYLP